MDDQELEVLLRDIESDRVERKASIADKDKIRQAICAFANDLPNHQKAGVVFVGVHDDATCVDLTVTDELLITLANMHSDGNITPFPTMIVQKRTLGRCTLAVIIVEPSDAPPVRYQGRVYIRIGPRRDIATAEEERRLTEKRRSKDLPFDIRPHSSATVEDMDLGLFQQTYLPAALPVEILEQNQRSIEQRLSSMRFTTIDSPPIPTILGLLVIGKDPPQLIPGAYIQFLRLDGTQLTDPIKDQKEISGPLPNLLRILDETFQVHISIATDVTTESVEIRHPDYPLVALQQIARNAVLHRTYEGTNAPVRISWFTDRIEILSPGGPYGQVNRENFGHLGVTDYRNPHLAEAMNNLGYVQRFGLGISLARQELRKNNNPPPEFIVETSSVLVILRKDNER